MRLTWPSHCRCFQLCLMRHDQIKGGALQQSPQSDYMHWQEWLLSAMQVRGVFQKQTRHLHVFTDHRVWKVKQDFVFQDHHKHWPTLCNWARVWLAWKFLSAPLLFVHLSNKSIQYGMPGTCWQRFGTSPAALHSVAPALHLTSGKPKWPNGGNDWSVICPSLTSAVVLIEMPERWKAEKSFQKSSDQLK